MAGQHLIETTAGTFEHDVLDASRSRPVLVDFWAEWCAPCRSIAPMLEELADELNGALLVAKVDTDREQALAAQFGIRSLPTMLLFRDGKPVQQVVGAQPKSAILAVIDPYLPRASDAVIEAARAAGSDPERRAAIDALRAVLESEPNDYRVHPVLGELLVAVGEFDAVDELLAGLPANIAVDNAFEQVKARLRLGRAAALETDDEQIRRYKDYCVAALKGNYDEAMEGLLSFLAEVRDWNDGAARAAILDVFTVMGDDPRIKGYRARLARAIN